MIVPAVNAQITTKTAATDKNFQNCYTTVMRAMGLLGPGISPAANVLPSFYAEVIQNMTKPIHVKPLYPGENMTSVEGTMSQIAQCMVRGK